MAKRVALIGIIVEDSEAADEINGLLHLYRKSIIGRMGVPHPEKDLSVISVAMDATQEDISALSGKIGKLDGVSAKTAYSNVVSD